EEAADRCVDLLGSAKLLARQIYEAHSQYTWRQTLLASMPHLLFGLLFALNWWQSIGWLLVVLVLIVSTVVYGWCRGKPTWFFPWVGYSLLPVVIAGLFLLFLPKGWSWLAILLYIPLALWLIYSVYVQTIKRDWLYSSLMLLPVPTIIGWLLAMSPAGKFPEYNVEQVNDFAPWIGLSFLALALAVAMFMRVRRRWLKVAVLFISGLITFTMVAYYTDGKLNLFTFLVLIILMLGLFVTPALLGRKVGHRG
ncbi:MAG: hypothetical protein V3S84_02255, partial [Dehalococcoidales bacterium]